MKPTGVRSVPWADRFAVISASRDGHADIEPWMTRYWYTRGPVVWVLGGARGGDQQARDLCDDQGWPYVELPALWTVYGKPAGMRRNGELREWSEPDGVLLAFPRGGPGTTGCIGLFRRHARKVFICTRLDPTRRPTI